MKIMESARQLRPAISRRYRAFLLRKEPKIFCISMQRTGTTSTGQFFKDHGFPVATQRVNKVNRWAFHYFVGDYESIFRSFDFLTSLVFEDAPWWMGDFYKVLYHRFPNSRFVLLERNADKWFDSMVSHSNGKTLGNTHRHCAQYQRLGEFYEIGAGLENMYTGKVDNELPLGEAQRQHYVNFYVTRNKEVKSFFHHHDASRLFNGCLEDDDIWLKMGRFFGITVDDDYSVHLNQSHR